MSVVETFRRGIRKHGAGAAITLTRYYAARVYGMLTGPGRECPLCGAMAREFRPFVELHYGVVRNRAACPSCGALERHRAYARFYKTFIPREFAGPIDVLHASPEPGLAGVLGGLSRHYDRSDYQSPRAGHMQLDLCNPHLPPKSYDLIVLNHVLMCIRDDRLAVRKLGELLRPGGIVLAGEYVQPDVATWSQVQPGYGGRFNQYGSGDVGERFPPLVTTVVDVTEGLTPVEREWYGIAGRETLLVMRAPGRWQPSATEIRA